MTLTVECRSSQATASKSPLKQGICRIWLCLCDQASSRFHRKYNVWGTFQLARLNHPLPASAELFLCQQMINAPGGFNGGTHFEVITVLANCGTDTDKARRALVTWIQRKQEKNRTTQHILTKLRDLELKFIKDTSLHPAFRAARAETDLPRSPDLPLPDFVKDSKAAVQRTNRPSMPDLTSTVATARPSSSSTSSSSSIIMSSPQSSSSRGSEGRREAHAESLAPRYSYLSAPPSPPQQRRSTGPHTSQSQSSIASTRSPRRESALEYPSPSVAQGHSAQRNRAQSQILVGGRRITPSNRLSAPGQPLPPVPSDAQPRQVYPILSSTTARVSPATSPISPTSPALPVTPNSSHRMLVPQPSPVLASEEPDLAVTERQFVPGHLRLASKITISGERLVTRGDSPVQGL
ncbi:hypothetical protein F5I97DRAFT_1643452 [Phlebopus sp. FC_14]|nr:hypothetical protein F5I97DRAFT_1643452 [Phlebopus sp. FC_14]